MTKLLTPRNKNFFFGYYDKKPINSNNTLLLSHEVNSIGKEIEKNDIAKINVINLKNNQIILIDETNCWNYQQGSQLQWLNENEFIYNFFKKNYFSKVINFKSLKCVHETKYPIYSLSFDKKIYSTIDYSRLNFFRNGYGYKILNYENNDSLLKICDFKTSKILVDIKKNDFNGLLDIDYDNCWVDHILFSPGNHNFTFLLRYKNDKTNLFSSLLFYDFKKREISVCLDTGMAGHGAWLNKENFVIWGRKKRFVQTISKYENSLIKKIINVIRKYGIPNIVRKNIYGDTFLNFNSNTKEINDLKLNIPTNIGGGHFSFTEDERYMISDTYHDKNMLSTMFKYDISTKKVKLFHKFKTEKFLLNKSFRCDLHPRIVYDNKVIIDSTHEGFRGIYILNTK